MQILVGWMQKLCSLRASGVVCNFLWGKSSSCDVGCDGGEEKRVESLLCMYYVPGTSYHILLVYHKAIAYVHKEKDFPASIIDIPYNLREDGTDARSSRSQWNVSILGKCNSCVCWCFVFKLKFITYTFLTIRYIKSTIIDTFLSFYQRRHRLNLRPPSYLHWDLFWFVCYNVDWIYIISVFFFFYSRYLHKLLSWILKVWSSSKNMKLFTSLLVTCIAVSNAFMTSPSSRVVTPTRTFGAGIQQRWDFWSNS